MCVFEPLRLGFATAAVTGLGPFEAPRRQVNRVVLNLNRNPNRNLNRNLTADSEIKSKSKSKRRERQGQTDPLPHGKKTPKGSE